MERIFQGDTRYTKDGRFSGHWNFFQPHDVTIADGKTTISEYDGTYAFEWKGINESIEVCYSLLGNYVIDFLMENTGCIWCEEWKPGITMTMNGNDYWQITTQVAVSQADIVETPAGKFENCILITLDAAGANISGFVKYLVGKKDYYFAPGIGIVKCIFHFKEGKLPAVYELTAYNGIGEGYMPITPGLFRRYESIGLTGGYIGKTELTFCEDDAGQLKMIKNLTGIRMFDSALSELTEAIEADPTSAELYEKRGYFKREIKKYSDALIDCGKAIELDSAKPLYFVRRGWLHCELGDYERAIADYNKAIELDANDQHTYYERSLALWKAERYADAVRDFNKSDELDSRRKSQWNKNQLDDWKKELEEKGVDVSAIF